MMEPHERYVLMSSMAAESGFHRHTIMAALQRGELHGGQNKKRGIWRAERACFEAWMRGDECAHRQEKVAA